MGSGPRIGDILPFDPVWVVLAVTGGLLAALVIRDMRQE